LAAIGLASRQERFFQKLLFETNMKKQKDVQKNLKKNL